MDHKAFQKECLQTPSDNTSEIVQTALKSQLLSQAFPVKDELNSVILILPHYGPPRAVTFNLVQRSKDSQRKSKLEKKQGS